MRQYDSRIGRYVSVDPDRQFASPFSGMGNNPIAGIDFDGGRVYFYTKAEAQKAALNINAIFKEQFGIENAISVHTKRFVKSNKIAYFIEFNEDVDFGKLDSKSMYIVQSFKDILDANTNILGQIVHPDTPTGNRLVRTVGEGVGWTYGPNKFAVPSDLPDFDPNRLPEFNIGSQILHETLWHISPVGRQLYNLGYDSNWLYYIIGASFGSSHPVGNNQNSNIPKRIPRFRD